MSLKTLSNDPITPRTLEQIQAEALKHHPLRRAEDKPTEVVAFAVAQHLRAVRARVQNPAHNPAAGSWQPRPPAGAGQQGEAVPLARPAPN